jgi:hypothetical protein
MYRASCTVYYPDQQINNIYIYIYTHIFFMIYDGDALRYVRVFKLREARGNAVG